MSEGQKTKLEQVWQWPKAFNIFQPLYPFKVITNYLSSFNHNFLSWFTTANASYQAFCHKFSQSSFTRTP